MLVVSRRASDVKLIPSKSSGSICFSKPEQGAAEKEIVEK